MLKSEKSHTGPAHDSYPLRAVLREHARPSWILFPIGLMIPLPSAVSFFLAKQAWESHPLRMRSHAASILCIVSPHPSSFCGRSNPNVRLITSSQLSLAISPTAILPLNPRLGGP